MSRSDGLHGVNGCAKVVANRTNIFTFCVICTVLFTSAVCELGSVTADGEPEYWRNTVRIRSQRAQALMTARRAAQMSACCGGELFGPSESVISERSRIALRMWSGAWSIHGTTFSVAMPTNPPNGWNRLPRCSRRCVALMPRKPLAFLNDPYRRCATDIRNRAARHGKNSGRCEVLCECRLKEIISREHDGQRPCARDGGSMMRHTGSFPREQAKRISSRPCREASMRRCPFGRGHRLAAKPFPATDKIASPRLLNAPEEFHLLALLSTRARSTEADGVPPNNL